jgi:hypothetical protein
MLTLIAIMKGYEAPFIRRASGTNWLAITYPGRQPVPVPGDFTVSAVF